MPQYVKHETVTDRVLTALPLASEDGSILVADRRGVKIIILQGTLIASSQANLDAAIDSFNELLSRQEKNLDISWNGSTRRYVATCTKHTYDRDHYNTNAVPWTAEFTVFSGEGKDTSSTTALNAHSLTSTNPVADSFTMSGSKPAKPYITIHGANFSAVTCGIEYKNTDTGEKIIINKQSAVASTSYFIIDCLSKKTYYSTDNVTLVEYPFYGVFPNFKIGTNNVQITCGSIYNQTTLNSVAGGTTGVSYGLLATTTYYAQSFTIPYTDGTFKGIDLEIARLGTPGNITVRIETDSNGSPSGTLVDANATISGSYSTFGIGTSVAVVAFDFSTIFSLTANTKYWIVVKAAATLDGSNQYYLHPGTNYPKGVFKYSTNSGSSYSVYQASPASFAFALKYGGLKGTSTIQHTVTYTKTYI